MGRPKLTTAEWVVAATSTHGTRYDYSQSVFDGYGKPITITCPEHGPFTQKENNHRNGAGCPVCGLAARVSKRRMSFEQFAQRAAVVHDNFYTYLPTELRGNRTVVPMVCPIHGEFAQQVMTHLTGQGCRKCGYARNGAKSQLGLSEFLDRANAVHNGVYTYVSGLSGMHKDISIRCPRHGIFRQTPHNHLKGTGCPRCVGSVSKGEAELRDFIASLGLPVVANSRKIVAPYELDVYVPSRRVAFEYHGLWYHRDDAVGTKTYDKWETCTNAGITLVQIFEDEWRDLRPQIEHRIRAVLGVSPTLGARKCRLERVPSREARAFLKTYHTQGTKTSTKLAYGLYFEGRLVALATFGKGRFNNSGYELLRYCSVGRVLGGISRLVAAFRRDYPHNDLVSYADLRWGAGDSYAKAGFVLDRITEPDYWWADCAKVQRISRYQVQPHKTGMPEKTYAERNRLVRISGVGHKKWVLKASA